MTFARFNNGKLKIVEWKNYVNCKIDGIKRASRYSRLPIMPLVLAALRWLLDSFEFEKICLFRCPAEADGGIHVFLN